MHAVSEAARRSRLQEAVHVTPDVGKFMQCLVQGELLVFYEACDAVPELAIRVQELFRSDVAKAVPGLRVCVQSSRTFASNALSTARCAPLQSAMALLKMRCRAPSQLAQ